VRITATMLALVFALIIPIGAHAVEIEMSAETAFQKASKVLVDLGAIPTFRDKELMVIKADPVQVQLTPEPGSHRKSITRLSAYTVRAGRLPLPSRMTSRRSPLMTITSTETLNTPGMISSNHDASKKRGVPVRST